MNVFDFPVRKLDCLKAVTLKSLLNALTKTEAFQSLSLFWGQCDGQLWTFPVHSSGAGSLKVRHSSSQKG